MRSLLHIYYRLLLSRSFTLVVLLPDLGLQKGTDTYTVGVFVCICARVA